MSAFVRLATYVDAPERLSAATAVRQLQRAFRGVRYVDGGWGAIVAGLEARLREAGGALVTSSPVRSLAVESDGSLRVGLSDGAALRAREVVVALPAAEARSLLRTARVELPGLESAVPARMATLDLALSRLPRPGVPFVLGVDEPLYLSVHSDVAAVAPEGGVVLHVARYLPPGSEGDAAADRAAIEALLDRTQPGWRDAVLHEQWLPRMTALSRVDLASEGGALARPGSLVPGVAGIALAGDWVLGTESLADAALATGHRAALALLGARAEAGAAA